MSELKNQAAVKNLFNESIESRVRQVLNIFDSCEDDYECSLLLCAVKVHFEKLTNDDDSYDKCVDLIKQAIKEMSK